MVAGMVYTLINESVPGFEPGSFAPQAPTLTVWPKLLYCLLHSLFDDPYLPTCILQVVPYSGSCLPHLTATLASFLARAISFNL